MFGKVKLGIHLLTKEKVAIKIFKKKKKKNENEDNDEKNKKENIDNKGNENKIEKEKAEKNNLTEKEEKIFNLEDKLIIFLFGISNLNQNDYIVENVDKNKINMNCEEFITHTLELIQNGKIVSLGLKVDVSIELYGDNIISLLKEIPEEYKKDNCKKLFELIKEDLNKSIEEITEKSKQLYNLYSKIELLPENEIEDLEKSIERDGNNQIQI